MSDPSPLSQVAGRIDARLDALLAPTDEDQKELIEAMRYSVLAPGKRLRPALCLAAFEGLGGKGDPINAACAIEMVHCFSLIHDDLPAMDDDDLRRGLPTCHVRFGEATAILAGDTLLAYAFELIANMDFDAERRVAAVAVLGRAAGRFGLGGGQQMDITMENADSDLETVQRIHLMKTARFMGASAEIGAILAGASAEQRSDVRAFGEHLGAAFQIVDDILDVTESTESLGKPAGSDLERGKSTYPSLIGLDRSRELAAESMSQARQALERAGLGSSMLSQIAEWLVGRKS